MPNVNLNLEELTNYVLGSLLTAVVILSLLVVLSEVTPEADATNTCTCAGKEDCSMQTFQVDEGRRAVCALWAETDSCCVVDPSDR